MIRVIEGTKGLAAVFSRGGFSMPAWERYIDDLAPGVRALCEADLREVLAEGLSWEGDFVPLLNGAWADEACRARAAASLRAVTEGLDARIAARFGKSADADIILYLGLGNGAGWVTPVNGKTTILMGLEKIVELGWDSVDDMNGLVLHELGHVYQEQYGVLRRQLDRPADAFLWQLFTEGIAMVFEQELAGGPAYYHQDKNGWKNWCAENAKQIARDFQADLPVMTRGTQRYFGDWALYCGRPDTGYYLGTRLVRHMMETAPFDALIAYDVPAVRRGFAAFLQTL
ncbi:MAG: hypothetical protein IJT76_03080 [Clostridia bacterium]|nr:hypothetical protein [Clostridia bacterium]